MSDVEKIKVEIRGLAHEKNAQELVPCNIYLIGFMGCGKSTVADCLNTQFSLNRIDIDELLVEKVGMSIADIFEKYGEEYFRNVESSLIIELQKVKQSVISCGGGAALRESNVHSMKKNGKVVWLTASPETIYDRVKMTTQRPLLKENMSIEHIKELIEKRKDKYEAAADIILDTENKTVLAICEELICMISQIQNNE